MRAAETTPSTRLRHKIELVGPSLALPARRLLEDPRARELYPPYLATGYHVTCAMLELMAAALERARVLASVDEVALELADYLERHLVEEAHHEQPGGAILEDLEAAGVDATTLVEAAASDKIRSLLNLQHGWIRDRHPVAVLGFLELEAHYAEVPVVEQLIARTGLPRVAFGQLLMHARVDAMHGVQLHQLLDSLPLTPAQEQLVGLSALTTLHLVAEALLETLDRVRWGPSQGGTGRMIQDETLRGTNGG
jgi:hypothetical protein